MTARRPSDRELAMALTGHVPASAPAGLRDRILSTVETTPQQHRLPFVFAPLSDADPVARRRALLLAVAVVALAALATAAAVGRLLELQRDRISLDPPADLAVYVDASYRGLAALPAFSMVALENGDRHVIHSDGTGMIRDFREATNVTLLASRQRSVQLSVDPEGKGAMIEFGPSDIEPGLVIGRHMQLSRDCETSWSYLGLERVLDRPTHRLRCDQREYWMDAQTGIVLRTRFVPAAEPTTTTGPSPSADTGERVWEVIEFKLGPQAADLFAFEAPPGYQVVSAYDPACMTIWFASCRTGGDQVDVAAPFVTPAPAADPPPAPADVSAFVRSVHDAYRALPAFAMSMRTTSHIVGDPVVHGVAGVTRLFHDGEGRFRMGLDDGDETTYISEGGHIWIEYREAGGTVWRDDAGLYADRGPLLDLPLLPAACATGWIYVGADAVLDRAAAHLRCGAEEYWVDLETSLVVRIVLGSADPLERHSSIMEVVDLDLGPQDDALFRLPDDAVTDP